MAPIREPLITFIRMDSIREPLLEELKGMALKHLQEWNARPSNHKVTESFSAGDLLNHEETLETMMICKAMADKAKLKFKSKQCNEDFIYRVLCTELVERAITQQWDCKYQLTGKVFLEEAVARSLVIPRKCDICHRDH
uniref:Piwi domain-containing protein n=1 Tax=Steinernema glaseri TaxID=37863 RepID=A0A1I8AHS7_9BILA